MHTESVSYALNGNQFRAFIAFKESSQGKMPAVLIAHAWMGQDEFARNKAKALAELGYVGIALDLYGEGKVVETSEEAAALMLPLFEDRSELRKRLMAGLEVAQNHPKVDKEQIGGIGFCFGGLAILELFLSGAAVKGVVSFHAVLGDELQGHKAKTLPIAKNIKGSCLVLHGYDDPLVSHEAIATFQKALNDAKIDWQMHIYGGTSHAFTVPGANDPSMGLRYNPKAEERSWKAMKNFFDEVF